MKKVIILMLFGLLIQSSSSTVAAIFKGKVIDKNSKKPLTAVLVTLSSGEKSFDAYTDRYGRFSFHIEPGLFNILCKYFVNVDTTIENVRINDGVNEELLIEVKPGKVQYLKSQAYNTEDLSWKFEAETKEEPIKGMGSIEGFINDTTGKPIFGVSIYIEGTTRGRFVKKGDGKFKVNNIEPGSYKIRVNAVGYKSIVQEVNIYKDSTTYINITMSAETLSMKEIIVHGDREIMKKTTAGKAISIRADGPEAEATPLEPSLPVKKSTRESGVPTAMTSHLAVESDASYSEPISGEGDGSASSDGVFYMKKGGPAAAAGLLTSGEVNDFRKWDLWQDISKNDFDKYSRDWTIKPTERYTIQLTTLDGKPAVDQSVNLISTDGKILWSGRTDNTGKAELWGELFLERSRESEVRSQNIILNNAIEINGRRIENVKKFHDGINFAGIDELCDMPNNVDILFTVDATGSMGDEIEYLKAELKDIIAKLKDKRKDLNFNLGSIFYRDIGDEYIVRKSNLSTDIDKTINFINEQYARGGGDYPEAVEMALQSSLNEINWSERAVARLLFLILDAPPHNKPEINEKLRELTARASIDGIRIIPIACSGVDKSTEYLMRALALVTNGTYIFLTDHSGIGNPHIEPTTDKYDVELLNDLFIRLIEQFTIVPSCSRSEPVKGDEVSDNIYNKDEIRINEKDKNFEALTGRLKCYPNPTNGLLNLELGPKIEQLFLVDVTGKILKRIERLSEGKQVLDMSSYPTGIYFIKFLTEGRWGSRKVMLLR